MPANRPKIPASVQRQILTESGHRCAACGDACPLERAHIIPWHITHEHKVEDLICLCANCHQRADTEGWGERTLRRYKENPWVLRKGDTSDAAVNNRPRIDEGIWYTAWQHNLRGDWVTDEVEVRRTDQGVNLRVVKPGKDFRWIIHSKWKGSFLLGEWESLRPASTAYGNITLKVSRQGTRMCGYWIGPADTNQMICGRVVVAKDVEKTEELKPIKAFRKETTV